MGPDASDLSLVQRVQRGERGAYDLLVLKYQHKVVKLVMRYLRDPADAEEVTRAVLGVLADHVSAGEVAHVEHLLPQEIRSFFLPTHRGGGEADPIRSLLW